MVTIAINNFTRSDLLIISISVIIIIILFALVKYYNFRFYNPFRKPVKIDEKLLDKKDLKSYSKNLYVINEIKIDEKNNDSDSKIIPYNALTTNKSKLSLKYWKDRISDSKHPDQTLLINMEMVNGFHRTFIIRNRNSSFKYNGSVYIVDNDLKYFNLDSKLYQLDYHENFTLPIKRNIPVEQIRKSIRSANLIPSQATNPALIEKFIQSKILESLMKGGQFIQSLQKFSFYLIILMSITAIHLLLFVYASGMLNSLSIPGF